MKKYEINNINVSEEFEDIRNNAKVDVAEFNKAVRFAMFITEGKHRIEAYVLAYNPAKRNDKDYLAVKANSVMRQGYFRDVLNRLITTNHIIFADKHYNALNKLYDIGLNSHSDKNRIEALKAFIDATKRPETKIDANLNINIGAEAISKLELQLSNMKENANLLTKNEEIIDVDSI